MKIHIRTFGCAHNQADSEMMAGMLEAAGHEVTAKDDAELILINSCTVKDPSQKRFVHEVKRDAQTHKVVVAGCVPQADPDNKDLAEFSAVGVKQLDSVVDVVEQTQQGKVVRRLTKKIENPPLVVPVKRKNPLVEIIPVNSGCLGKCTFCKTKHARGHLSSYSHADILEKAKRAIAAGVKEIRLTSEDLGAYGRDIGTNIVKLANELLALEGDFRVRLGMANPPLMLDLIEELIEVLHHPKCYKFIHLPVQSGSDSILEAMQREYTIDEFELLVNKLQDNVPDITIATDVIVGFPGETDEDHQATRKILEQYQFPIVNISKFYARPGTPAAAMQPVQTKIVKARSEELHQLCEGYEPNKEYEGRAFQVLFTEPGKSGVVGRTANYRTVIVDEATLGATITVHITSSTRHYLLGERHTSSYDS